MVNYEESYYCFPASVHGSWPAGSRKAVDKRLFRTRKNKGRYRGVDQSNLICPNFSAESALDALH